MKLVFLLVLFLAALFQAGQVGAISGGTSLNLIVNNATNAEITEFSINPPSPNQNQYIDIIVTVENTGNLDIISAEVRVNISNSDNITIANITLINASGIPKESTVDFTWSWYTNASPLGDYTATAIAYYGSKSTPETEKTFSIQAIAPPVGGAGGGVISTPIIPPEDSLLKFTKLPVLIEVRPGDTIMTSLIVKNPTESDIAELGTEISGIPEDWVDIIPANLSLGPNESGGLNMIVGVPLGAWPGTYKVGINISNEVIHAENFFILRVKPYPYKYEKPIVTRSVGIDKEKSKTLVSLKVENSGRFVGILEVIEKVPKIVARTAGQIEFDTPPPEVLEDDPVVKWALGDLDPYETRTISYELPKILEEYSPLVYWPIKQVNVFYIPEKPPAPLIKVSDIEVPSLRPGETKDVSINLMNVDTKPLEIIAKLESPTNWKVEPEELTRILPPLTSTALNFNLTPPLQAMSGSFIVTFKASYNEQEVARDVTVFVQKPSLFYKFSRYAGAFFQRPSRVVYLFIFLLVIASIIIYRKKRRRYREEDVATIHGMRRYKGFKR